MKHAEWNREVTNHDIINYQRRHRKWALKRGRGYLRMQQSTRATDKWLSDVWQEHAEKAETDKAKLVEALAGMLESYDVLMRFIPGSDSGTARGMVIGAFIHEPTKARAVIEELKESERG